MKVEFVQSFVSGLVNPDYHGQYLFMVVDAGNASITVAMPARKWADTIVTYDGRVVNMKGEYPSEVNSALRLAKRMFPNWQT